MKHWMPDFKEFEHLEGTPGQPGARFRIVSKAVKQDVEVIETIAKRNLHKHYCRALFLAV